MEKVRQDKGFEQVSNSTGKEIVPSNIQGYTKLKSFLTTKETISKVSKQPTGWDNIGAKYASDRVLMTKIYEELQKNQRQRKLSSQSTEAH